MLTLRSKWEQHIHVFSTYSGILYSQRANMNGATRGLNDYFFLTSPFIFLTEPIKLHSHILDTNRDHGATTVVINWNSRMPPFIISPYFKGKKVYFLFLIYLY